MTGNYFSERRSCRNFRNEKISSRQIKSIIERAVKAPTCGNMQLYSIIVTESPELLRKLSRCHYDQPASATAPLLITVCADFNRFTKWCEINKANAGYDNFHSFLTAMTDAVIVAQQIVTIAEQEGLGTCYLGTVTYNAKEISEILNLPSLVVPVAAIALGVPEKEGEKTDRLPLEGVLHYDTYKEPRDFEVIDIYKIHDENPENDKFIKEHNKENLAQVFAEIRYPKDMNEQVSASFMDLLKEKGFLGK